jgi:hypothetical protein
MDKSELLANAVPIEERSLSKLQGWLDYEKYTWMLGAGVIWFSYAIIITGLLIMTVVFTPYMLWHLYKAKWYKSIGWFFITVLLPFVLFQFFDTGNMVADYLLSVFPLFNFYCFTWVLSYMIGEYIGERQAVRKWKRERHSEF